MSFFFFNDTATTEIYTLSLHDALPIWGGGLLHHLLMLPLQRAVALAKVDDIAMAVRQDLHLDVARIDRKSTRLNSSHANISYAVFCLQTKHRASLLPYHLMCCFHSWCF